MKDDLEKIIEKALKTKTEPKKGRRPEPLKRKVLAMIFEKPSLRTRVSFEVAASQLGGSSIYIGPDEVQMGKRETVEDVAKVLSGYADVIMYRAFSNEVMCELAKHATVPVINGLDDREHPCQCAADLMTVMEKKGKMKGLQLAYVGDGNNVCNSLLLGCAIVGMNMRAATPKSHAPDADILSEAQSIAEKNGCVVEVLSNPFDAVDGADVVYTDTWVSMGQEEEREEREQVFMPYQVNAALVERANKDWMFMHCLPAHRGYEVAEEVIDGPNSVVFLQAENRMPVQKAILATIV